jgi:DNA-directed RNA polymerase subunit RPC12/RpoP
MAKRYRRLRCKDCGELIDREDLVFCERCGEPLHEWCTMGIDVYGYEDARLCEECAEELEDEIKDSDEYGYSDARCPLCGTPYVREENLVWCPNCGYEPF